MATCIINNIVSITLVYRYHRVIYYIHSFNYQFDKIYVKSFIIDHLVQLVTYIYYLQFIIKNNLSYLHQPLHFCISFEYVFIV